MGREYKLSAQMGTQDTSALSIVLTGMAIFILCVCFFFWRFFSFLSFLMALSCVHGYIYLKHQLDAIYDIRT